MKYSLVIILIICSIPSCYYDVEEELYPDGCLTEAASYTMDVLPILRNNCFSCHDQSANFGNVTLEGYDKVLEFVNNGELLGAIKHEDGFAPMPQNAAQLVACDIEKIENWIAEGAKNN